MIKKLDIRYNSTHRESKRVEEVNANVAAAQPVQPRDEGAEEREAHQAGGADGEALSDGGRGVAGRVEGVLVG